MHGASMERFFLPVLVFAGRSQLAAPSRRPESLRNREPMRVYFLFGERCLQGLLQTSMSGVT